MIEIFLSRFEQVNSFLGSNAGVVYQHVEPAKFASCCTEQIFARFRQCYVSAEKTHLNCVTTDDFGLSACFPRRRFIRTVVEHDVVAGTCKLECDSSADTSRSSGN